MEAAQLSLLENWGPNGRERTFQHFNHIFQTNSYFIWIFGFWWPELSMQWNTRMRYKHTSKKKKYITSVLYQHSYCCTLLHKQSSAQPTYKNSTLWGKKITACPTSNYQHGCVCGLICTELHKREENILNVSLVRLGLEKKERKRENDWGKQNVKAEKE